MYWYGELGFSVNPQAGSTGASSQPMSLILCQTGCCWVNGAPPLAPNRKS